MAITAISGPQIVFKDSINPEEAPSLFTDGVGLLDPRAAYTYSPGSKATTVGWHSCQVLAADYAPAQTSNTCIAASATVACTTISLVTSNTGPVTVGDSTTVATNGATASSLLRIDNKPAFLAFGTANTVAVWDPANPPVGRNVTLTSAQDVSALAFTINGYDAYGYPQTQTVTGPSGSQVTTTKTFKWVSSVTANGTSGNAVSVGVGDTLGFPLRVDRFAYATVYWNNILQTVSTFTAADANTANTTTGDVRGKWTNGGTASNGSIRVQMLITVPPANLANTNTAALFGVTPA